MNFLAIHNPAGPIAGAAAAHFAAATPNHIIQEEMVGAVPWFDSVVIKNAISMQNGFWEIPSGPGLGVEIDEREAAQHPYQPENYVSKAAVMDDGIIVDW